MENGFQIKTVPNQNPETEKVDFENLLKKKQKNKLIPILLAALSVFVVVGAAMGAYFVSIKVNSKQAVAPNAAPGSYASGGCTLHPEKCSSNEHCVNGVCKKNDPAPTGYGTNYTCTSTNCPGPCFSCNSTHTSCIAHPNNAGCGNVSTTGINNGTTAAVNETPGNNVTNHCNNQCATADCHCLGGDACTSWQCDTSLHSTCLAQGRSWCVNMHGTGMTCCEPGYTCWSGGDGCIQNGSTSTTTTTTTTNTTCTDSTWTPDTALTCTGTNVTQTSNCGNTRTVPGTKVCCTPNGTVTCNPDCPTACGKPASTITTCTDSCGGPATKQCAATAACCTDTTWTPNPNTVCAGQKFTQTSNCGATREGTGTKDCSVVGACMEIKIYLQKADGTYNTVAMTPSELVGLKIGDKVRMVIKGSIANLKARFRVYVDDVADGDWLNAQGFVDTDKMYAYYSDYEITKLGTYKFEGQVSTKP